MGLLLFHIASVLMLGNRAASELIQEERIYTVSDVSVKPEPASGLQDFQDNWSKKVVYPEDAIEDNIQGVVFIEFVVNTDGTIDEVAVRQGIGHGCDEAALKGFKEVSKDTWKPGIRSDQPVKVKMVLPFYFRILKK